MMKLLLDALPRSIGVIAGLVVLVGVVGLSAYFGSRFASSATPTAYRSAGPMVKQLEGMGSWQPSA